MKFCEIASRVRHSSWLCKRNIQASELKFHRSVLDIDVQTYRTLLTNVLHLNFGSRIRNDDQECILIYHPLLSQINNASVCTIAKTCPNLEYLNLNG